MKQNILEIANNRVEIIINHDKVRIDTEVFLKVDEEAVFETARMQKIIYSYVSANYFMKIEQCLRTEDIIVDLLEVVK